ncbi:hypothetical protein [Planomonospora algeriensis]
MTRLREFLTELEDDRAAGMYATEEARTRFRRQYVDTAKRIEELESLPDEEPGWVIVDTGERLIDRWAKWDDEQRGEWLRDSKATATVRSPEVRRARVPLAERVPIHLERSKTPSTG